VTPRVVYDCMVFLQAATNATGASGECLRRAVLGDLELCVSLATLAEVRDVLTRPRTVKKFPSLTPAAVNLFLKSASRFATVLADPPAVAPPIRDPKDAKYLDLAIAAGARVIVSRDNDLLDLMKPDDPHGVAFRAAHPAITILDPAAFLATLPPT
jgi:putative PIN family toxin of toxin-antitoxin system